MGYDKPRSLGDSAQAALYTAPIFRDFMKMALKDTPDTPFRVPPGNQADLRRRPFGPAASGPGTILEAFKPGTAPPTATPRAAAAASGAQAAVGGGGDQSVGSGTGGLY